MTTQRGRGRGKESHSLGEATLVLKARVRDEQPIRARLWRQEAELSWVGLTDKVLPVNGSFSGLPVPDCFTDGQNTFECAFGFEYDGFKTFIPYFNFCSPSIFRLCSSVKMTVIYPSPFQATQ